MRIGYLMQAGAPDMLAELRSGPATHVWHICDELQQLGHSVRLLTRTDRVIWRSDDLKSFDPVHIRSLERGLRHWFERGVRRTQSQLGLPYLHLFESLHFAAACRQELADCDILYERMGWMGYGGAIASWRSDQPLILEVNGDHLAEYEMLGVAPQGLQRSASIRIMRSATRQAAQVVATGAGWRRRFLERWPVDPQRVTVVENGSEVVNLLDRQQLATFAPLPPAGSAAAEPVRLVYVGAFEPWHGITVLLRALAQVVAQHVPVHLDLIGDGSELGTVERMITENHLAPYVSMHGFLPIQATAPILAGCEIGLSPYCGRVEYSGLKLLDYKAAGLATIASGQGGEPGVLRHGVTGWIVPPCDVEQLAAAIATLCQDAQRRRGIGQAARVEAEAQHSWRHTARQLEELFTQVIQSRRGEHDS
jgi:glycosyltransferase involved in cell wall biosynthesis